LEGAFIVIICPTCFVGVQSSMFEYHMFDSHAGAKPAQLPEWHNNHAIYMDYEIVGIGDYKAVINGE
jgi:hypothetical protein